MVTLLVIRNMIDMCLYLSTPLRGAGDSTRRFCKVKPMADNLADKHKNSLFLRESEASIRLEIEGNGTGTPEGIRTPNLLIRSQMLYPLSYGRTVTKSNAHEHISQSAASLWHCVYSALSSSEPDPNRAPISCAIQTLCHTPRTLWAAGHSWFAGYLSWRKLATIASRRNWASPGSMSS